MAAERANRSATPAKGGMPRKPIRMASQILAYTVQTPSGRGAATLVRVKGRNVITGQVLEMTFKAGEKFAEPDLEKRRINYLYSEGDTYHFMDEESFEQFALDRSALG